MTGWKFDWRRLKKYQLPVEPDTRGLPWVFGPTSPRFSIGSSVDLVGLIRSTALSFSPSTPGTDATKISKF